MNKLKIAWKIWLPAIIFSIALIGITFDAAMDLKNTMMEDRSDKVRSMVEGAHSVVNHYAEMEKQGTLSREDAQTQAKNAIRAMRYDGTEYFWINDTDHVMVMHPIKPALDGKKLDKLKDANGKLFFTDMVTVVKKDGAGFVDYLWPKPGHEEAVEKVSYVKLSGDWGWVIGSGLYLDDVEAAFTSHVTTFVIIAGLALVIAGGISFLVANNLSGGLKSLSHDMDQLASGTLDIDISGQDREDEVGDMARALEVFKENAQDAQKLRDQQEQTRQLAEQKRREAVLEMADNLQGQTQSVIRHMSDVVTHLGSSANTMQNNAKTTSEESASVATISAQTSSNVQTVAAAAEELNASSSEIGRQVEHTNQTAQAAANEARQTNEVMQGLNGAASKIGEVVSMIQDIAEQTNLLALNATIEAARAGEAGKGFAVVASEVKNLANQTARATDEVTQHIATVQKETGRAVDAIEGISRTINNMHDASSAIAAAVEEQHAAIQEISRSVQEAARGTDEISHHINTVSSDADQTKTSAQDVLGASQQLQENSSELENVMNKVLEDMRSSAA